MPKIYVNFEGKSVILDVENGANLYSEIIKANIPMSAPCGGKKTCGKCKVKVLPYNKNSNFESKITPEEASVLTFSDLEENIRLACFYSVEEDIEVNIGRREALIQTKSVFDILVRLGGKLSVSAGYGIAVDIGTTTIAAYLYRMSAGEKLGEGSIVNSQNKFGADVISRIQYTIENSGGLEEMRKTVAGELNGLFSKMCRNSEISFEEVKNICIVGNTTMLHFLMGEDAAGIAVAPFIPKFLEERLVTGEKVGFNDFETALVYLLPSVSAYVGADITSSVLASGMHLNEEISLLVDIGTNGEIVLGNSQRMICCSTAAGPAFEGAKISCGMGGVAGAISKIEIKGDSIEYKVIGGGEPVGICGSGIIDGVAELLRGGIIDETGYMDDENFEAVYINGETAYKVCDEIYITQKDIREVQLAKAAIAAGIKTLTASYGIGLKEIKNIYIAGGFGSYIDIKNGLNIGLIPKELEGRITAIGNAAGAGACLCLLSDDFKQEAKEIAAKIEYIELSNSAEFQEIYVASLLYE